MRASVHPGAHADGWSSALGRGQSANNFFSNGTFWDILGHLTRHQLSDARTPNATRLDGAKCKIASEAYYPMRGRQIWKRSASASRLTGEALG